MNSRVDTVDLPHRDAHRASRFWHRLGRTGLWRLFGNTLPLSINLRYLHYGNACRATTGKPGRLYDWPFRHDDGVIVRNAMPRNLATEMVDKVSAAIAGGTLTPDDEVPFNIAVIDALTFFDQDFLSIFDGSLGNAIETVMGSPFRIEWLQYYRTIPGEPDKSWLWHIDNDPPFVLKVLLYLTDTTVENGATRVLSQEDTKSMFGKGYFGVFGDERRVDIDVAPDSEQAVEVRAGDALLFSPNQLHKGGEVRSGFRDTLTFLILPSPIGWRDEAVRRGRDYMHSASGFPRYPKL